MSSTPLVSVLMTSYNREDYIAEAIESVRAQTLGDFELIISDDCSKDRTVEVAKKFLGDPRIHVHINEKNLGDYPNRQRAVDLARGKYLKFVDSDDAIYPHCLDVMVRCMESHPDACAGIGNHANSRVDRYPTLLSPRDAYAEHFVYHSGLFDRSPLSVILRADLFREAGGFTGRRFLGDYETWLKIARRYPIVVIPPYLGFWRAHSGQENQLGERATTYISTHYECDRDALMDPQCPLSADQIKFAIRNIKRAYIRRIFRAGARGHVKYAISSWRNAGFSVLDLRYTFLPEA